MHRWVFGFFVLLMLATGQQVFARDAGYILSRGYFEDKTNTLTLSQVEHASFTPYQEVLIGGYKQGTYWIKLRVRASRQDLVLKMRPAYTDEIELFDPASKPKPLVGANFSWDATDLQALSYNFLLPSSVTDRDIYLRVKSKQSYLFYAEIMPIGEYMHSDRVEQLLYVGYAALTLILAMWLLVTWLMSRELVLGVFTIQQFMAFFHTFTKVGLAKVLGDGYWEATTVNHVSNLIVVSYPFVGFLSNRLLLQEYGLKAVYRWIFDTLLVLSALVFSLYLLGYPSVLGFNAVLVLLAMIFFWVCAMFGVDADRATLKAAALPVTLLRVFYTFNAGIWLVAILPLLGVFATNPTITLNSILVYNLLSGLTFFILLQYRSKALLKLETERSSSLKVEAEQERKQREEQSMLMAMLSHEIKTPLSILKLVVDEKVAGSDLEGHANRAVRNIDFIVERCLQLGKLDAEAIQMSRTGVDCKAFLTELLSAQKSNERAQLSCAEGVIVNTDQDLFRVVISNLLENAMKYSPADSTIDIGIVPVRHDGLNCVQIVISNHAGRLGVPDPDQVFKKYYRNTSATKISGSGLGLFLVKELVGVLGGNIHYETDGKRVSFTLWMPS